ncbi:MAG: sulfatase [Phycisphaeraceae bacterium]|nr:sulfatase [Phycisphaeraceae bacterium]
MPDQAHGNAQGSCYHATMHEKTPPRPNIIWVFGDQHRAQAQGHAGDPNLRTPHMDRLTHEGVHFHRAVAGNPWCTPFRGSLLTSRYPHECVYRTPMRMDPSFPTIAHALTEHGYDTAWFGKWHLDGRSESEGRSAFHIIPRERRGGFQTWIGYENNNSQYDSYVHGHEANGAEVELYKLPGHETDALTDLLIDYVRGRKPGPEGQTKPFFAALSVQPPHDPYLPAPFPAIEPGGYGPPRSAGEVRLRPNVPDVDWVRRKALSGLPGYYHMIENLDFNLGRIRRALDRAGLAENTLIIFFSDHGDMHGSHGKFGKSVPWEESIRIPFSVGGGIPIYGRNTGKVDHPINHVDIAPTTLGLCGISKPDWMRGYDYSGFLNSKPEDRPDDAPESAFLQQTVRKFHPHGVDRPWRGVVTTDGWKYVCLEGQPMMLHNLNDDPYEQVNLAFHHVFHQQRSRLQECLADWISRTGDSFALPEL